MREQGRITETREHRSSQATSRSLLAVGVAVALATIGCGPRTDRTDRLNALRPASAAGPSAVNGPDTSEQTAAGDFAPPAAGALPENATGDDAGSSPASPSAAPRSRSGAGPAGATTAVERPTTAASKGSAQPGTVSAGKAPAAPVPARPGVPPTPSGKKSEVVLGSFGVESGILGSIVKSIPPAIRAWAADVNSRGGLNGHPIRIVTADDGGDPVRTQAVVRRMVEQDKVLAFMAEYTVGTLASVLPYLEQKNVPLIGVDNSAQEGDGSPMVFHPLLSTEQGFSWSWLLNASAQTNKKKLGLIFCRELSICENQKQGIKKLLPWNGFEVVYEATVSMAQPDYTAEAIQARQAGAEILMMGTDAATVVRFARAAGRQNYRPIFEGLHQINMQSLADTGKADVDGTLVVSRMPVWQSSPKMAFYRDAMKRYSPGAELADLGGAAFVYGKLIEKVVAPALQEPPTTAQVLQGLYSTNKETLGGLLPGVTFNPGPHGLVNWCVVPTKVSGGNFLPYDPSEKFVCAPGWKPVEKAG